MHRLNFKEISIYYYKIINRKQDSGICSSDYRVDNKWSHSCFRIKHFVKKSVTVLYWQSICISILTILWHNFLANSQWSKLNLECLVPTTNSQTNLGRLLKICIFFIFFHFCGKKLSFFLEIKKLFEKTFR